jgi:soluble lytic murein transglycosylase-like protein
MQTEFLVLNEHPPHEDMPGKKGSRVPCGILFIVLIAVTCVFRFQLPYLHVVTPYLPADYQNIQQTIEKYSGLNSLYSLLNPNFLKKQETIKEILVILEKYETGMVKETKEELAEVIYEEATRNNHDPKFILALIAIESSFQNQSVSERGAKGLMQIMPYVAESIAKEMGIEWSGDRTLFNPSLNIKMGVYYFTRLLLDFKDPGLALTAYNYGPTYVRGLIDKKQKVPQHFCQKILSTYQSLLVSTNKEDILLSDDIQVL